jgi:hypothetical protein
LYSNVLCSFLYTNSLFRVVIVFLICTIELSPTSSLYPTENQTLSYHETGIQSVSDC